MASRPNYRVTKTDGETGRRSTVSRTTTGDAAQAKRQERRASSALGSSDSYGVNRIEHR